MTDDYITQLGSNRRLIGTQVALLGVGSREGRLPTPYSLLPIDLQRP